jgi:alkylation response protein AidB-like acyl-CoA dehydrogenase
MEAKVSKNEKNNLEGMGVFLILVCSAWITNSKEAGLFVVFATTDPALGYKGISAFVVDKRSTPGLTVQKPENKLGIRASSTCEVTLQGVRVPPENVLGPLGKVSFFFSLFLCLRRCKGEKSRVTKSRLRV